MNAASWGEAGWPAVHAFQKLAQPLRFFQGTDWRWRGVLWRREVDNLACHRVLVGFDYGLNRQVVSVANKAF